MERFFFDPGDNKTIYDDRIISIDKIRIMIKVVGLSVFNRDTDLRFWLHFEGSPSGTIIKTPVHLFAPGYYTIWEHNQMEALSNETKFRRIKLESLSNNNKSVKLEVHLINPFFS